MSYDKYIKYKNKYLQLKAKYTQVGGVKMWTIIKNPEQLDTTPITKQESDALNHTVSKNLGKNIEIKSGELKDINGNNVKDAEGKPVGYRYTINSDGTTGQRISKKGTYKMTLTESTFLPPPAPTASSASYRSPPALTASSASYRPPSTPPPALTASSASYRPPTASTASASYRPPTAPSTPASANIHDIQKKFPDLPAFMSIYESNIPNAPSFIALVVEWNDLFFLDINKEKNKDGVKFKKIDDKHVDMTFRGNTYSLENNDEPSIWMHILN